MASNVLDTSLRNYMHIMETIKPDVPDVEKGNVAKEMVRARWHIGHTVVSRCRIRDAHIMCTYLLFSA